MSNEDEDFKHRRDEVITFFSNVEFFPKNQVDEIVEIYTKEQISDESDDEELTVALLELIVNLTKKYKKLEYSINKLLREVDLLSVDPLFKKSFDSFKDDYEREFDNARGENSILASMQRELEIRVNLLELEVKEQKRQMK